MHGEDKRLKDAALLFLGPATKVSPDPRHYPRKPRQPAQHPADGASAAKKAPPGISKNSKDIDQKQ